MGKLEDGVCVEPASKEGGRFQERLSLLIKESGKSQRELAESVGVTKQSISLYVSGKRTPDVNTLDRMCTYFHVTADYLLGRSDSRSSNIEDGAINAITGLSNEAIKVLKNLKDSDANNVLEAINLFIVQEKLNPEEGEDLRPIFSKFCELKTIYNAKNSNTMVAVTKEGHIELVSDNTITASKKMDIKPFLIDSALVQLQAALISIIIIHSPDEKAFNEINGAIVNYEPMSDEIANIWHKYVGEFNLKVK